MSLGSFVTSVFALLFDAVGAIFLSLYAVLIGPLGILRGPLVLDRLLWYAWVLAPLGVLTCSIRAILDWRVGNFSLAIHQAESILALVSDSYQKRPSSIKRRVLLDFYTLVTRSYLHIGHIDKAMQVILLAKKKLGVEKLPELYEIDAKTAHLIRAGIAAGRMLDGHGLATMFVKADKTKHGPEQPKHTDLSPPHGPEKATRVAKKSGKGKLLPFPKL